jgi:hypothetical protein
VGVAAGLLVTAGAARLITGGDAAPAQTDGADAARTPVAPATASRFPAEGSAVPSTPPSVEQSSSQPALPSAETSSSKDPHADLRRRVANAVARCTVYGWNDEGTKTVGGEQVRVLVFDANMTRNAESADLDAGSNKVSGQEPGFVPTEVDKHGVPTGRTFMNKVRSGGGNQALVEVLLPASAADGDRVVFGTETSALSKLADGTHVTTTTFVPCDGDRAVEFDTGVDPDKWVPVDWPEVGPYSRETIG